jgi:uncharacterized protein DUF5715
VYARTTSALLLAVFVAAFGPPKAAALHARTQVRHFHHSRRVCHIVWNPVFKGSHDLLLKQNEELDRLQLPRIANDEELERLEQAQELVPLRENRNLRIAPNLIENRRYCRPWTRDFVEDMSLAYYEQFHQFLQVNSAVRTIEQQHKLRRHNRNAGPESGETASTHLTGVTIDISKRGLTRKQHQWLEAYMLPLKDMGLIDPVEERRQPVFHIVVFDRYGDWHGAQYAAIDSDEFSYY